MPTFTTIALHSLLEPKASKTMAAGKNESDSKQGSQVKATDKQPDLNNSTETKDRKHHWTQISPALYTTPEPTPLLDIPNSPSSFTPSPYIVNHKGRGPRFLKPLSQDIESHRAVNGTNNVLEPVEGSQVRSVVEELENDNISNKAADEQDNEMDDFFDPQDSLSVRSSSDGENSFGLERSLNLNSSASEFYDAWEELSSESGSQPSSRSDFETELREIRLSLLVEMEKRKQAEEKIDDMRSQWGKIREQLSLVGLNLTNLEDQSPDDLSHQVDVIRFVSDSIGRGIGKAEVVAEMEAQLDSKNFEIARLMDRLRYYEAVNHEMSQRNQESIETMRGLRQRRKRRQRWIWGSIVAAVAVGSAALLLSYVPTEKGLSSTDSDSSHTCEGSRSSRRAGVSAKKEAPVNFLTDPLEGRSTLRPADVLVFGWIRGKHACVDLTGVSPLVSLRSGGFTAGQAALKADSCKVSKHEKACLDNQHVFIPFAFDTFGFLAPKAVKLLKRVQRVMHSHVMTPRSMDIVFKRISFAIQKGVAAQLVARLPSIVM